MNIEHNIPKGYEGKGGIRAAVLAKSVNVHQPELKPIVTFLIDFPRFILPELNTHRQISKCGASSRAIPVAKQIERVLYNPGIPIHFGKNQAGMVAETEVDSDVLRMARFEWDSAASNMVKAAKILDNFKIHKQVVNRLLEPFSFMRMVVTGTEWDNFFWLRLHKDADPHIAELARVMLHAYQRTEEVDLQYADWHTPFFGNGYWTPNFEKEYGITAQEAINHSMSCCAQTSYRKLDMSEGKTEDIISKLFGGDRVHCFSEDTEVLTANGFKLFKEVSEDDLIADVDINTCKLVGFAKPLAYIQGYHTGLMFEVNSHDLDFKVTSNHQMLGHALKTEFERQSKPTYRPFKLIDKAHPKSPKRFMFECPFKLPTAPILSIEDTELDPLGQLIGMYIGDGCKSRRQMRFHFKKARKVVYLQEVLNKLGLEYSLKVGDASKGTKRIVVKSNPILDTIFETCGISTKTKRIGVWDISLYPSIFDGLKNSDGSLKRNTWSYSTTSEKLKEDFLSYASLAGLTVSSNKPQRSCYKLMVKTTNFGFINDSRMCRTKVKTLEVSEEPVYCLTMPSGALITRRNGKTLVTGNSSPSEHQAKPLDYTDGVDQPTVTHKSRNGDLWSNNLRGWGQYRTLIPNNNCTDFDFGQAMDISDIKSDVDMF